MLFQFGGRLVTFEDTKPQNPQQPVQRQVYISQVVTETDFVTRSNQLEVALLNGQFAEFCSMKIANSKNEIEENIWNFLKASVWCSGLFFIIVISCPLIKSCVILFLHSRILINNVEDVIIL